MAISRQRTCPIRPRRTGTDEATTGMVPTFAKQSIGQRGAQLYSGSIAMPTPQAFNMASPPMELHGFGVDPRRIRVATRCKPARIHQI